jgi:spore coat polysaccharide biosynthesis protein SpsF
MTIGAIVQARVGSRRLPGKVLREVAGKPLLCYTLERLQRCAPLGRIVVATSVEPDDDAIADLCGRLGVACHRGPLNNVARRFAQAAHRFAFTAFVRICGDSPLIDPAVVARGVELFNQGEFDLVTNVMPRTFPPGQSVEVVDTATFTAAVPLMRHPEETEHVTSVFYAGPERHRIRNFAADRHCQGTSMVVDTPRDLERFEAIIAKMTEPHWRYGVDELMELAGAEAPATPCGHVRR